MAVEIQETDYLVIGAGAMSLAFADEVFRSDRTARITLIDQRAAPGGHWNDAYPFVSLHQPAAFYGVNSAELGNGGEDLSSRAEILAYFERALKNMVDSGCVQFLPKMRYLGDGRAVSLLDDQREVRFRVNRRIVDGTYMNVEVPSTHPPRYEVAADVNLIPLNGLAGLTKAWERYVIIGAGKTGIDAILFLLDGGVDPARIQWIVSHDMWLWNRSTVQPRDAGTELLRQLQAIADCGDVDAVFERLERAGSVFRLNPAARPSKWRCATVSPREFQQLQTITDVVRLGRVQSLSTTTIQLERGRLPTGPETLHVDCSANGLAARETKPVFAEGHITLQSLLICQQVFSAAVIGHLETRNLGDDERNAMWLPVPHPENAGDMPVCMVQSLENTLRAIRRMPFWWLRARLNVFAHASLFRLASNALWAFRLRVPARAAVDRMLAKSTRT